MVQKVRVVDPGSKHFVSTIVSRPSLVHKIVSQPSSFGERFNSKFEGVFGPKKGSFSKSFLVQIF